MTAEYFWLHILMYACGVAGGIILVVLIIALAKGITSAVKYIRDNWSF